MGIKIVKHLGENKWVKSKLYPKSHAYANREEKKKYPNKYEKLNKWMDKNQKQHEYIGMNYKNGKVKVEKRVPKEFRPELVYHEREELKKRKQLQRKLNGKGI